MTDKEIYAYFGEAANYADPAAYASDVALSLMDPEDPDQDVDTATVEQLMKLWRVANDPFRVLLDSMGLSLSQCSARFCIPYRTVQDWAAERRSCAPYIRLMMAELTGLVHLRALE